MAEIFTAAAPAGLSTGVSGLLLAFVAINLMFLGYRMTRKSGVK
jgi:hypothetical protein